MKDIYELLNDINVDLSDDDFAPVSEFEKKKVTKALKSKIIKKKRKRNLVASIIALVILTGSIAGLSTTTYAKDIPLLGSIFKLFTSNSSYVAYEQNAKKLHLVEESNGIKLSIIDGVFDGKTLFLTYTIETDIDLGEKPAINSLPIYGDTGLVSSEQLVKTDEGKYISLMTIDHYAGHPLTDIDVKWDITSIATGINHSGTVYEGNWNFDFQLSAVDTNSIVVNETLQEDGLTFTAQNLTVTPMSFILSYETNVTADLSNQWDNIFVSVEIEDDLGNKYTSLNGLNHGSRTDFTENWLATYDQLDARAKAIYLTPIVTLTENDIIDVDKDGNLVKANYRSINSDSPSKQVRLDPIKVQIQ
ncbi:DUF4179 domain-containing protein [Solibacillus merdavium]|uniref:DUF4179 domain-containing protein n=1 Tax=Solibacillus merdavium TaxID=2762218 RepID=A0ABR8XSR0_9BACL|nr:DUF4179 domain-containing protein [Solibacillus merdavium]MBD8034899.1 DUF4179 domain-containing protein [Solibacillus merdavium]